MTTHQKSSRLIAQRLAPIGLVLVLLLSVSLLANSVSVGRKVSITADGGRVFYVSPNGSDSNTGADEQNAFMTPAKASTAANTAGDTVVFMDGTYTLSSTWTIKNSGTSSGYITYKAQHPRQAKIIGPSATLVHGTTITASFIELQDLVFGDAGNSVIRPQGNHIVINNCEVYGGGRAAVSGTHAGQGIGATGVGANYLVVKYSKIHNNNEHDIYIDNGIDNIQILYNEMYESNGFEFQINNQGDQSGGGSSNALIAGNKIYNTTGGTGGMNLMAMQDSIVRNNVIYTDKKGISLSQSNSTIASKNNTIIGNTIVVGGYGALLLTSPIATGNKAYNNVLIQRSGGSSNPIVIDDGDFAALDNNVVYNYNSDIVARRKTKDFKSTEWQALGFDVHSKFTDPKFVNNSSRDYHLQSSSPAIGLGTLSYFIDTDIEGKLRIQAGPLDAGAYAYNFSGGGSGNGDGSSGGSGGGGGGDTGNGSGDQGGSGSDNTGSSSGGNTGTNAGSGGSVSGGGSDTSDSGTVSSGSKSTESAGSTTNNTPTGTTSASKKGTKKAAPVAIDKTKTLVRVDGANIPADGSSVYRIVVTVRDAKDSILTDRKPKVIVSGDSYSLSGPEIVGNEWFIKIASKTAGERKVQIIVDGQDMGISTLNYIALADVAKTEVKLPSDVNPPSPVDEIQELPDAIPPEDLNFWQAFVVVVRSFFSQLYGGIVDVYHATK